MRRGEATLGSLVGVGLGWGVNRGTVRVGGRAGLGRDLERTLFRPQQHTALRS